MLSPPCSECGQPAIYLYADRYFCRAHRTEALEFASNYRFRKQKYTVFRQPGRPYRYSIKRPYGVKS